MSPCPLDRPAPTRRAGQQRTGRAGRRGGERPARADERGSATAELAAAVPALMLLVLASLSGIAGVITKLRCVDAAREAALATSRGESGEPAARRAAPRDATVTIRLEGDLVRAVVQARVLPLGRHLPGITVQGEAVAALEPE